MRLAESIATMSAAGVAVVLGLVQLARAVSRALDERIAEVLDDQDDDR